MQLRNRVTEQKLMGAYYTPPELAKFMVDYFSKQISSGQVKRILEPSCGDGIFLEALNDIDNIKLVDEILCVEIKKEEAEKARNKASENTKVITGDFIKLYQDGLENKRFDLIVGNPPYIRYQYLDDVQRNIQSEILIKNGMKPNKLINAWVCFLVAAIGLLNEGGQIGFVIPAEILQVAYAEDLRLFLSRMLDEIVIFTFKELVFENIGQEVVVLMGKKSVNKVKMHPKIAIQQLNNLNSLKKVDMKKIHFQRIGHTKDKWTKYFISANRVELINKIKTDSRFTTLDEIGLINVGITTGNNKYFSVNKDIVSEYELDSVVRPLIGRSSHAHGIYFTNKDLEKNIQENKNSYLIDFPKDISYEMYPKRHKEYIKLGEHNGENIGYKCRIRDRWYIVPSIWAPDAFLLRRNNTFPKFVLNDINAVSTDTMHRIKFNVGVDREKILLSYYNSITFAFTEINGRSYGGGVLEILPSEAAKIILPDLTDFDNRKVKQLLQRIDDTIRNDLDIDSLLDEIDNAILVEFLGLDPKVGKEFRGIWKTLMERRRGRGK